MASEKRREGRTVRKITLREAASSSRVIIRAAVQQGLLASHFHLDIASAMPIE